MFKYIWIVMLAIIAMIYLGYLAYCIYQAYKEVMQYVDENESVAYVLGEVLDELTTEHEDLIVGTIIVIMVALANIFVVSLICFIGR